MADLRGINYLRGKLKEKRDRVITRYRYYDMKHELRDPSPIIPEELKRNYASVLGWCAKSVDSLADRLSFREFDNDEFNINDIFNQNNPDILFDSAILSSLIAACSFVYISKEGDDVRLQVIDGANATGEINPITGLLTEGYAVLERNVKGETVLEAYFDSDRTIYYRNGILELDIPHDCGAPLLVPIIYRPDATRPFGHSRISRACMSIMNKARNTITRTDVSAEFYSFPQKYLLGTDPSGDVQEDLDRWKMTISTMLTVTADENGGHPVAGTFPQQSMEPSISQLRMYASLFAGETGLTLDDLGFATDNPSSAEAIKAQHENLRLTARKAQKNFGRCFLNVGYVSACLRDDFAYSRKEFYKTKALWEPLFEPDFSEFSAAGDGLQKLITAAPGYLGPDNLRDMLGIEQSKNPFPAGE